MRSPRGTSSTESANCRHCVSRSITS
jgi:hypothetical protein